MGYKDAMYLSALNDPRFMGLSDNGQCLEYWTEPDAQTGVAGRINVCANTENEWKALFDGRFGKARTNPARDIKRSDEVTKTVLLSQGVSEDQLDHELAMTKLERGLDSYMMVGFAVGGIGWEVGYSAIVLLAICGIFFAPKFIIDGFQRPYYKAICGNKELACKDGFSMSQTNSGIDVFCKNKSSKSAMSCPAGQDIYIVENNYKSMEDFFTPPSS